MDGLRKKLGGLAESLEETMKVVEEMARQRDVAREEAKKSRVAQRMAMEEAAKLRASLEEARKGEKDWKRKSEKLEEKVKTGAMAHEELQKFRGELQGALKEFTALKGDLGKARSEIQDPVERAELKRQVTQLRGEQTRMGAEVEMTLSEKKKAEEKSSAMQAGLEKKLQAVMAELKEAKEQLQHMAKMKIEKDAALNDQDSMRKELAEVSGRAAKMKMGFEADERGWIEEEKEREKMLCSLEKKLVMTVKQLKKEEKAQEERQAELTAMRKSHAEKSALYDNAEAKIAAMKKDAEKPHQALKRSEESRRKVMEQVKAANAAAGKIKVEMATLKKAKAGLEELLFRKADEVRELKAKLKKAGKE